MSAQEAARDAFVASVIRRPVPITWAETGGLWDHSPDPFPAYVPTVRLPERNTPTRWQRRREARARRARERQLRRGLLRAGRPAPSWNELHGAPRGTHVRRRHMRFPHLPLRTTSVQLQALWPVVMEPSMGSRGVIAGFDTHTQAAFFFDGHELIGPDLPSSNVIVTGELGQTKTTLLKTIFLLRPLVLGRQVVVIDSKTQMAQDAGGNSISMGEGEYVKIARALGMPVIKVARSNGVYLNPFDLRITRDADAPDDSDAGGSEGSVIGQDSLLRAILQHAHGGDLTPEAGYAVRCAHNRADEAARRKWRMAVYLESDDLLPPEGAPDRDERIKRAQEHDFPVPKGSERVVSPVPYAMTMEDLHWHLVHPTQADADRQGIKLPELHRAGLNISYTVDRFIRGDLSGYVNRATSVDIDFNAPLIVFDLSEIDGEDEAMPIVMGVIGVFLRNGWLRFDGVKRIFIVDEGWHIIGQPYVARLFRRLWKFARALGLENVAAVHHLSDLPGVDDPASAARALLNEATIKVAFHEEGPKAAETAAYFSLSGAAERAVVNATPGISVWKIGQRSGVEVAAVRTELEKQMTASQQAYGLRD